MNIYVKLTSLQEEMKAPKNQYNNFGKYKYRSCEDILEALKPLLKKYELTLVVSDSIEMIGDRYYIKATCRLSDGKDMIEVSALARESLTKKGMDDSQVTGTASSYARKYALNGLFLIDDTKDADTEAYRQVEAKANTNTKQASQALTEKQINRLFAIATKNNFTKEDVDKVVAKKGKSSVKELSKTEYDELIERMEKAGKKVGVQ